MQRRSANADSGRRNVHQQQGQSASGVQAAVSPSAHKNTNRAHDTSGLTNRLKHLDECIEQVKSLMKNLEKSDDPNAQQHMLKLYQMLHQLNAEQASGDITNVLFNALTEREQLQARAEAPEDSEEVLTTDCFDGAPMDLRQLTFMQEDKENLMRQNAIMRKILESKAKLMELEEQRAVVSTMQKKAENKLAEARAFQEHLATSSPDMREWVSQIQQASAAGTLLPPPLESRSSRKSGAHKSHHSPQSGGASGGANEDGIDWKLDGQRSEVEQLQLRLQQLQDFRLPHGMLDQLSVDPGVDSNLGADLSDFSRERQKLERKIRDLQEQKMQVDNLLAELTVLQAVPQSPRNACGDLVQSDAVSSGEGAVRGLSVNKNALKHTSDEKRRLQDMKKSLQQLSRSVQKFDQNASLDSAFSSTDVSSVSQPVAPQPQQLPLKPKRSKSPALQSLSCKKDNLWGDFPARRHYEAEGRANEDADAALAQQGVASAAVMPAPLQAPVMASNGPMQDGSEALAEKVRQLQATRNRLQYLQDLVSSLQDEEVVPDLMPQTRGSSEERNSDNEPTHQGRGVLARANTDGKRTSDVLQKQRELLQLQEHQRSQMLLRQQLAASNRPTTTKNQLRAGTSDQNCEDGGATSGPIAGHRDDKARRSKKDNLNTLTMPKNLYDSSKPSNRTQDHSNLEITGNRERAMLEELLKQEHRKHLFSYSHNEDIRSVSSCSAGSEAFEGSVLAGGDTTIAATWGGSSTQENLEDDDEAPENGAQESEGSHSDHETNAAPPETVAQSTRDRSISESNLSYGRADNTRLARSLSKGSTTGQVPQCINSATSWPIKQTTASAQPASLQNGMLPEEEGQYCAEKLGLTMPAAPSLPNWPPFPQHLQQQFEHTSALCNSILQDQQALTSALLATSTVSLPGGPVQRQQGFDIQQYSIQQQQQLLLSIIHCYHILNLQQLEISQLQQNLQHLSTRAAEDSPMRGPPAGHFQSPDSMNPLLLATWSPSQVSFGGVNIAQQGPVVSPRQQSMPDQRCVQGTLNNQVVPGTRANNFWDNFRSYSRQNLLSGSTPAAGQMKSNELPVNFHVQQLASGGIPEAAFGPMEPRPRARASRGPGYADDISAMDSTRHPMRPVPNANVQELRATNKKSNTIKQESGMSASGSGSLDDTPGSRRRQPSHSACDALKSSIQAELSRLLTNNEDTGSLAVLLRQLQTMDAVTLQMTSASSQGSGGARRKVPSLVKSNVPKENSLPGSCRLPDPTQVPIQRVGSESSPDLHANAELYDPRLRTEDALSDSLLDKSPSKLQDGGSVRKKVKGRYPASCAASWPTSTRSSTERNDQTENLIPEHDKNSTAEEASAEMDLCMLRLTSFLRKNTGEEWNVDTLSHLVDSLGLLREHQQSVIGALRSCLVLEHKLVSDVEQTILTKVREAFVRDGCPPLAAWGDARPEREGETAALVPALEPTAVAKVENDVPVPLHRTKRDLQATESCDTVTADVGSFYNFHLFQPADVPRSAGAHVDPVVLNEPVPNLPEHAESVRQEDEQEDEEDRETGPETEPEDTQDLAEADQSPAAGQDAADRNPEGDVQQDEAQGAVAGAVGGLNTGEDDPSLDNVPTKLMASEELAHAHEEPVVNGALADDGSFHEGPPPLPSAAPPSGREG
ncbi:pericentriolar material 1 protein-like isoform X3 [Ornithodoros turicata]|uniref:pericentriolar material 1 protein-like isoform X3 n=1 Tax=Ornithodoros turicata TaxID=34597 RepID=UPI003138CB32